MSTTTNDEDEIPVLEVTVRIQKAKLVQRDLAVAQGRVQGSRSTRYKGFKDDEPCQVSIRSISDVSRLQQYLKVGDGTLIRTGRWWTVEEDNPLFLSIRTALTIAIERNRHGVKLLECVEIIAIQESLREDSDSDRQENADEDASQAATNFLMHDKSRRHALFADWLIDKYGKDYLSTGSGILDVAGGKGELSLALLERGISSVVLDPAPRFVDPHQNAIPVLAYALEGDGLHLLEEATPREAKLIRTCSIIVGMHPDQATEPIVLLAQHLKVPFSLLPCCVIPSLFPHRMHQGQPVRSYRVFSEYLQAMQDGVQMDYLPFMGRNMILYSPESCESDSS